MADAREAAHAAALAASEIAFADSDSDVAGGGGDSEAAAAPLPPAAHQGWLHVKEPRLLGAPLWRQRWGTGAGVEPHKGTYKVTL
jgi:hypothetical protein